MKRIFKGINIILSLVLIFIAIAVAFIAFPQFGNKALIVRSGSMSPTIGVGSIVVVRANDNPTYGKGDVIAFRSEKNPETIITHRVIEIESGPDGVFYKTKGDANEEADGWSVDSKNVLGKVQLTLPYAGQFLGFVKSDLGFLLLIAIPAAFVIMLESWSIINEIKKQKRQNQRQNQEDLPFGFRLHPGLHPGGGFSFTPQDKSKLHLTGLKIIAAVFIFALSISVSTALAFLNDTEESTDNIIQAADDFSEPVPEGFSLFSAPQVVTDLSPAPTPGVEPSTTPTPSPTPAVEPSISPEVTP